MLVVELQKEVDPDLAGAKSANLGRIIDLGLSVPPGAIITRTALRLFLEESGLLKTAQRVIDTHGGEGEQRTGAYKTLCEQVLTSPIPSSVENAVSAVSEDLLAKASYGLAVRSSGVHEDSATASFAGVYDSFLGVRSEEDLWRAIRRCWCGYWSPRAVDYAHKMGVTIDVDGMAVLLQTLVNADSAGVLFTVDPLTGNPWQFVLESSLGLARDLVASTGVSPADRYLFEWDTGEIVDRKIAEKETILVPSGSGGLDNVEVPSEGRAEPSLRDGIAIRIAQVGLQIDRAFGARVDIEWVVEGDDIHIVQVRPVTAVPSFFPHHLPPHLADRTWLPAPHWHFPFSAIKGKVMPPLYRDTLIAEKFNRYLQLGTIELPTHRRSGAEMDFHGHRYVIQDERWPRVSATQREQYLIEYEPQMRADYLHDIYARFPASEKRAIQLAAGVNTLADAIDALLWAREEMWEMYAITGGPSQGMFGTCLNLLREFVDTHLPDVDVNDLMLGHHAALEPYFPQVLVTDAENMAQLLEPERERFDGLSLSGWIRALRAGDAPSSFITGLDEHCVRRGLWKPSQFIEIDPYDEGWETVLFLRLIRSALKGGQRIVEANEEATRRREAVAAEVGKTLAEQPEELERFERLHDWALFWGPALNNRAWTTVAGRRISLLFREMQKFLQRAGLVDSLEDVGYYTVEDLKVIVATGNIKTGRRLWQRRRLEYECFDRLDAPDFLGKPPPQKGSEAEAQTGTDPTVEPEPGTVIDGKPGGPGRNQGIVRRIETLEEGDDAGEEHVVVIVEPIQSRASEVSSLFSLMLRVRGIVVPDHPMMWMHHVGQIARECRLPIVRISQSDMERLVEGGRIDVDGSRGTVTLLDPK